MIMYGQVKGRRNGTDQPLEGQKPKVPSKMCIRCQRIRPLDKFTKNRVRADGLSVYCKDCAHIIDARYRAKSTRIRKRLTN